MFDPVIQSAVPIPISNKLACPFRARAKTRRKAEWARSIAGKTEEPFESVPKRSGSCFFHVCQLQIHVSSEEFTFAWIGTVTGIDRP